MADIHFYQFDNGRLIGHKKELMENDLLAKYKTISDFDENKMREVRFSNIDNMPQKDIVNLIVKSSSDIFYKIIFDKVKWFEYSKNEDKQEIYNNITINNSYNGVFVEMYFEINNEFCDYEYYVKKMTDTLGCIKYERSTRVIFDIDDTTKYYDADNEISALFNDIQMKMDKNFVVEEHKLVKKVVFANLLKEKINGTGYKYLEYEAGDYITYKLDSNNNCLQLIWAYNWSLKQVCATIRYIIPYSIYGYTLHLPTLKDDIDKCNIEKYIDFILSFTDIIMCEYSDNIAKKFPPTPSWYKYF